MEDREDKEEDKEKKVKKLLNSVNKYQNLAYNYYLLLKTLKKEYNKKKEIKKFWLLLIK